MRYLIIYDNTGFIYSTQNGTPEPREPVGVPFLWVEIPPNKYVERVDVSNEKHIPVFADFPKTEIELLRLETARSNTELFEMMLMMNGGV